MYYQTSVFTCGPASLMVGMTLLSKRYSPSIHEEYQIWRESNSIFMGDGHPGCGPFGLAVAAHRRGFTVMVIASCPDVLSTWTLNREEQTVARRVLLAGYDKAISLNLPVVIGQYTESDLLETLSGSAVALLLTWEKEEAHWILVKSVKDGVATLHDPWSESGPREKTMALESLLRACRKSDAEPEMACLFIIGEKT